MRRVAWFVVFMTTLLSTSVMAEVSVTDPWARLLPPTVKTTAGYLTILSSKDDRLLSASSVSAASVEIHQTTMQEGVMSMSEVAAIELKAGRAQSLSPGGFHLMIQGLSVTLEEGLTLPLVLEFEESGSVRVDMPVRAK